MQSHDDVRKEEQTQEETPHDEREGGDDDRRRRRPGGSLREPGLGSCIGDSIPPPMRWRSQKQPTT